MSLMGFPISARLPDELGLGQRFWYWKGASGRTYIHSVYAIDNCPPVAGAVYVAVRNTGSWREALAIGRFANCLEGSFRTLQAGRLLPPEANEIHVHLLARDAMAADRVLDDLTAVFESEPQPLAELRGFHERGQLALALG